MDDFLDDDFDMDDTGNDIEVVMEMDARSRNIAARRRLDAMAEDKWLREQLDDLF
jgi:hypothetical protein